MIAAARAGSPPPSESPDDEHGLRRVERAGGRAAAQHDAIAVADEVPAALPGGNRVAASRRARRNAGIARAEIRCRDAPAGRPLRVELPERPTRAAHALAVDGSGGRGRVALEEEAPRDRHLAAR